MSTLQVPTACSGEIEALWADRSGPPPSYSYLAQTVPQISKMNLSFLCCAVTRQPGLDSNGSYAKPSGEEDLLRGVGLVLMSGGSRCLAIQWDRI